VCRGAPALIGEALRQEWRLMMRLPCEMFQGSNSIVQSFTAPASPPVAGRSRKSGEHRRSPDGLNNSGRIRRREGGVQIMVSGLRSRPRVCLTKQTTKIELDRISTRPVDRVCRSHETEEHARKAIASTRCA